MDLNSYGFGVGFLTSLMGFAWVAPGCGGRVESGSPDAAFQPDGGGLGPSEPEIDTGTLESDSGSGGSDGSSFSQVDAAAVTGTCKAPVEAVGRWIAFDADRVPGNRDIYLVQLGANGLLLVRLTTDPSTEKDPAFSNDGTRLAFASDRSGTMEIYVMNLATKAVTQLTSLSAGAEEPSWSRDDSEIVFRSGISVFLMNADGTNSRLVQTGISALEPAEYPSMSADGTQVLFDTFAQIQTADVDGGGLRYVVDNTDTNDETPAFSPDGVNVAFAIYCWQTEQIAVTPFDTSVEPCSSDYEYVTPTSAGSARRPAWGTASVIAFEHALPTSTQNGYSFAPAAIALSASPGSTPCDLVTGPGDSRNPNWAPVGFEPN